MYSLLSVALCCALFVCATVKRAGCVPWSMKGLNVINWRGIEENFIAEKSPVRHVCCCLKHVSIFDPPIDVQVLFPALGILRPADWNENVGRLAFRSWPPEPWYGFAVRCFSALVYIWEPEVLPNRFIQRYPINVVHGIQSWRSPAISDIDSGNESRDRIRLLNIRDWKNWYSGNIEKRSLYVDESSFLCVGGILGSIGGLLVRASLPKSESRIDDDNQKRNLFNQEPVSLAGLLLFLTGFYILQKFWSKRSLNGSADPDILTLFGLFRFLAHFLTSYALAVVGVVLILMGTGVWR